MKVSPLAVTTPMSNKVTPKHSFPSPGAGFSLKSQHPPGTPRFGAVDPFELVGGLVTLAPLLLIGLFLLMGEEKKEPKQDGPETSTPEEASPPQETK